MQHKFCFTAIHRLFINIRSVKGPNKPLFGGVLVIFKGDFAQILPVVINGL
jgi:hypothetical protein